MHATASITASVGETTFFSAQSFISARAETYHCLCHVALNPNPHDLLKDLYLTGGFRFCPCFGNCCRWTTILTNLCIMQVSDEAKVCCVFLYYIEGYIEGYDENREMLQNAL